jgi:dTDP-glucose 4,6-dehydratase/UDP-glucose 4-epimerase
VTGATPGLLEITESLCWKGPDVEIIQAPPSGLPPDVPWDRLTRLDRSALGAGYALDEATGGQLRERGDELAVAIRVSWTSMDGAFEYLSRLNERHRYTGMIRDFAQMGGASTYHYVAKCLGIRGYATFLVDDFLDRDPVGLLEDLAALPDIDGVVDLQIRLGWPTANGLINACRPSGEEVTARLMDLGGGSRSRAAQSQLSTARTQDAARVTRREHARDGVVLVTGAAGFLGRRLVRALSDLGVEVLAIDNLCVRPIEPPIDGLRTCSALELTERDLSGVSCIYHLAAWKSVPESFQRPERATENILAGQRILELAVAARVPRIIMASSCEVYGIAATPTREDSPLAPRSAYAQAKASVDYAAAVYRQQGDQEIVIARLFNSYGPGERPDALVPAFCRDAILRGEIVVEGSGQQRRDFSHVADTVAKLCELSAIEHPPAIVNIASGESRSVLDIAELVMSLRPTVHMRFSAPRPREITEFRGDTSLADMTFAPRKPVDVTAGVADTFEWWDWYAKREGTRREPSALAT